MSSPVELESPIARTRRPKGQPEKPVEAERGPGPRQGPEPMLVSRLRRPEKQEWARAPAAMLQPGWPVSRIALALVLGTVAVALAGQLAAFAVRPVVVTYNTGREIRALENTLRQEIAVNQRLQQDVAYAGTRAGIEQQARRLQMVFPGEVALSVVNPHAQSPLASAPVSEPATPAAAKVPVADRIRIAIETCFAVLGSRPGTR